LNVKFNSREATHLKEREALFGSFGPYSADVSMIHGQYLQREFQSTGQRISYWFSQPIEVVKGSFQGAAKLRLPASVWEDVGKKKDPRKLRDREKMRTVLDTVSDLSENTCFTKPLQSKTVSKYASPRTLPNGKTYYHSGLDLRAWYGTPIPAMGKGIVVLTEKMVSPGNVVVIDHGGQIFSRYMHLKKILVKEGEIVNSKTIIGKAGATGRVEGPHLHWDIIWKGIPVDPQRFIDFWNKKGC
jgi:murein DD-endopeptidase MepM/ murein hydrolase activator NlpD